MQVLLTAATAAEIAPLVQYFDREWENTDHFLKDDKPFIDVYSRKGIDIHTFPSGIGMVATTQRIADVIGEHDFDLCIQAGIAGSFDEKIKPGDVVFVTEERFGDLGVEDNDDYKDVFEIGMVPKDEFPFANGKLLTPLGPRWGAIPYGEIKLPKVSGLSVNTVSGSEKTIRRLRERYNAQIETMEGAAFAYACLKKDMPFVQIRAVSNYVTIRDRSAWKVDEAIANLNKWLVSYVDNLKEPIYDQEAMDRSFNF